VRALLIGYSAYLGKFGSMSLRAPTSVRGSRQRGYVLLILLLAVALLSIGFLAMMQSIEFQVKRDREEELIHRGVQYSRAVRRFFKKFGRYPTRVEELEDTNNIRFLRKRYKDPLNRDPKTGQERDFKILRLQDVQTSFNSTPTRGMVSASELASADAASPSSNDVQAGAPGALSGNSTAAAGPGPSAIAGQQNAPVQDQNAAPPEQSTPTAGAATAPPPQPLAQQLGPNGTPQVFGGGGIAGVASLSKEKTIRVFNKKDHYNQWQFIYDPTTDRGGLLMTPNQPPLMNSVQNVNQQQNGQSSGQNPGRLNNGFSNPNPGSINNQNNNTVPQPNMPPDQNQ
jgi:type II secretory pathway pseudopilin PulG